MTRSILLIALVAVVHAGTAQAHQVEAGDISIQGGAGIGSNLGGSRLAASQTYVLLDVGARYNLNSIVGLVLELGFGISDGTLPLRIRAGTTFHVPELDWPIQPYGKAELCVSQLFGVLGADLTVIGIRGGVGIEYFLTAQLNTGLEASLDLGSTVGQTPAFYGTFELVAFVSYTFDLTGGEPEAGAESETAGEAGGT